jgi:cholinesterase
MEYQQEKHRQADNPRLSYRLDILGFHGDPASRYHNPGFLDQRMAVEWVRDNIAAFGGDISRITLMGQSAGAASVDHYGYSWRSEPIVSGLILESGTAGFGKVLPSNNADKWYAVSTALGCGNANTKSSEVLSCLQSRNITDLLKAKGSYSFKPTVDNITGFPNYPALAKAGKFAQLPILIGNNDFETGLYIPLSALSNVTDTMVHWETQANITFACPAGARANVSFSHGIPTWRYRWFGNFPNTRLMTNPDSGAYHCSEVPFIWDTLPTGSGIPPDTEEEISIRAYIQGAWAAFAKNPSCGLSTYADGWPQYSPFAPSLVRLAYDNVTGTNTALPDLYDSTCFTTYPIPGSDGLVAIKASTTMSLFSSPSASGDVETFLSLEL